MAISKGLEQRGGPCGARNKLLRLGTAAALALGNTNAGTAAALFAADDTAEGATPETVHVGAVGAQGTRLRPHGTPKAHLRETAFWTHRNGLEGVKRRLFLSAHKSPVERAAELAKLPKTLQ